ncbi:uncharacterized protein LOC126823667 isoform X2 [Patella vulgata]|uniref:uncharacterized protein LOC126823667 isoform X2 n=1 Tax=Patella vulgata TaxID=6465 RepID=UPI0021803A5B|nr:uncharacterized protein LOC126823667 isoform X2 [Patella vulgata]
MNSVHCFSRLIKLAKLVALYRPNVQGYEKGLIPKTLMCWIWGLLIHGVLWFFAVKVTAIIFIEDAESRIIPILAVIICFFGFSYSSSLSYFALTQNFSKFCEALNYHQSRFGTMVKMPFIRKANKTVPYIIVLGAVLVSAGIGSIVIIWEEEMERYVYPLTFDSLTSTAVVLFTGVVFEFIVACHAFILEAIFLEISILFIYEFKNLNKQLQISIRKYTKTNDENTKAFENTIEKLRQEYISLIDCFESSNALVRHFLFGYFAVFIPTFCFMLYGFTRGSLTTAESVYLLLLSGSILLCVAVFTIAGATLSVKAHEPLDELMNINLLSVTDKTSQSVLVFVSRITGPTIGFRVYELFTLDTNTILTDVENIRNRFTTDMETKMVAKTRNV